MNAAAVHVPDGQGRTLCGRDALTEPWDAAGGATCPRCLSAQRTPDKAYKVICISIYTSDLAELDAKVEALKARGVRHVNRSALIRHALEQLDLEQVPRGLR